MHGRKLEKAMVFLAVNIEFFLAPFTPKTADQFYKWSIQHQNRITPFSDALKNALKVADTNVFLNALHVLNTSLKQLSVNQDYEFPDEISSLLNIEPALLKALLYNTEDGVEDSEGAIKLWYQNAGTLKDRYRRMTRIKALKSEYWQKQMELNPDYVKQFIHGSVTHKASLERQRIEARKPINKSLAQSTAKRRSAEPEQHNRCYALTKSLQNLYPRNLKLLTDMLQSCSFSTPFFGYMYHAPLLPSMLAYPPAEPKHRKHG